MSLKIVIFFDDVWRIANPTSIEDKTNGSIQAELNGQIISLKKGRWLKVNNSYTDSSIKEIIIERNISHIMEKAMIRKWNYKEQKQIDVARNNPPHEAETNLLVPLAPFVDGDNDLMDFQDEWFIRQSNT